ncbi:MAG: HmuY family protein [Myxococcota bacterium]
MLRSGRAGWLLLAAVCACSSGGTEPAPPPEVTVSPDGGVVVDTCNEDLVRDRAVGTVETVSTYAVATTSDGTTPDGRAIQKTTVGARTDFSNESTTPFTYLRFSPTGKVEIHDRQSFTDTSWDLGFKNAVVRANGGQSGSGSVEVAWLDGVALEDVTSDQLPGLSYTTDVLITDECRPNTKPRVGADTAVGEWFIYDPQTHHLDPKDRTYVLKGTSSGNVLFRITSWYDDENVGGQYTLRWTTLP